MDRDVSGDGEPLRDERVLVRTYIIALLVIAVLALVTHLVVDGLVAAERTATRVVDVAGGQRMLSQRIGGLAVQLAHEDDISIRRTLRGKLAIAAAEMRRTHVGLLRGDSQLGIPGLRAERVDSVYFDPPHRLDLQVRTFLGAARNLVDQPVEDIRPDSVLLAYLINAPGERLLHSLETAVNAYVEVNQKKVGRQRTVLWVLLGGLLLTITLEGLFIFRPVFRKLFQRTRELYDLARTDPLTGSHNRRSFAALAEAEHERIKRSGHPCGVLMLDIDHFKAVNDTHGHHVGDDVIKTLARTCVDHLRRSDIFGRLGGEEFAVILPDTPVSDAMAAAEKLRAATEALRVPLPDGGSLTLTISIGVSRLTAGDESIYDALNRADAALYRAKTSGRSRVESGEGELEPQAG